MQVLAEYQHKTLNISLRFIHLSLQILAAYWAIKIDGYFCEENNVSIVSYLAYGLLGFNLIYYFFFASRTANNKAVQYGLLALNLGLIGAILYFAIDGSNHSNSCAPTRLLYEFFFIETIICLVVLILVLVTHFAWADRYANWPGNLAWAILFLKSGFPHPWEDPALAIGILFAIVSLSSLIVNAMHYKAY